MRGKSPHILCMLGNQKRQYLSRVIQHWKPVGQIVNFQVPVLKKKKTKKKYREEQYNVTQEKYVVERRRMPFGT